MEKRRVAAAAAAAVMLSVTPNTGAQINKISHDEQTGNMRVQGSFPNNYSGTAAAEVLKPGKTVSDKDAAAYVGEIPVNSDGSFDAMFRLDGISGEYMLRIGADGQIFEKPFVFVNQDEMDSYLREINNADSAQELGNILERDYGRLKNICSLVIAPEDKSFIYSSIFEQRPSGGFKSFDEFKQYAAETGLINEFLKAKDNRAEKLAKLFDYFDDEYLPALDVWNNEQMVSAALKENIALAIQNKEPRTIKKIEELFADLTVTGAIGAAGSKGRELKIITAAHSLINADEYDYFSSLSEAKKISALSLMKSNSYSSIAEYRDAFDKAVKEYKKNQTKKPTAPSGSSGSSSGGSNAGFVTVKDTNGSGNESPSPTQTTQPSNEPFTDLDNYSWAKASIEKLRRNKIINGKESGIFAPSDNVKREEFTSMIIKALSMYDDNAAYDAFGDVKKDDWYYRAVASAVAKGIIKGMSDDTFGAGLNITRQDAVLICKNAAEAAGVKFEFKEESYYSADYATDWNAFEDIDTVADYARDAVYDMQRKGLVNGKSGKNFVPLDNMTRAEAAVLIDRIMDAVQNSKTAEEDKDSAVFDMMTALGMYDGSRDGLDTELTRADAAKILCTLMILPQGTPGDFQADDLADNINSGYIYAVCTRGLMSAEDNKFNPDGALTFDEAVKIGVSALGGAEIAESGAGYESVAGQKNMLTGIEKTESGTITKRNFLKMFYNIKDENVYLSSVNDGKSEYTQNDNKTFLSYYHDIYKEKSGKVTANSRAGISGEAAAGDGCIKIGSAEFACENRDYDNYIGREVEYYYRGKGGDYELVYMTGKSRTKVMTLSSEQIDDFSGMEYTYIPDLENENKTKKLSVDSNVNVVYNTQTIYDFSEKELNPKSGYITFVDANGDGKYDKEDTLVITSYKNVVVSSISKQNEIIYDKYTNLSDPDSENYNLDLGSIGDYTIKDMHGDEFGLGELREWDILASMVSPDGKYAEITLVDEAYGGTVTGVNLSDDEFTVDDRAVEISDDWRSDRSVIKNGNKVTVYYDMFGKAAAVRSGIAQGAETSYNAAATASAERLAILAKCGNDDENDGKCYIKTYWNDEKFTKSFLADYVKINGSRYKNDDCSGVINNLDQLGKAILIKFNSDGLVSEIITAALPGQDENRGLWLITYPGESLKYKGGAAKSFGNRFMLGDVIYTVPQSTDDFGDADNFAYNNASFENDRDYTVDAYTTTWQGVQPSAIVYRTQRSSGGTFDTGNVFVVSSITEKVNENKEPAYVLDGYNYSLSLDTVSAKSFELDEKAIVVDIDGNKRNDFDIKDLAAGDIISYGLNGNKLSVAMLAYDNNGENYWVTNNPGTISAYTYGGYAYSVTDDGGYLTMCEGIHPSEIDISSYENGGKYLQSFKIRKSSLLTFVDMTGKKVQFKSGSPEDIQTYVRAGNGCSRVAVCCDWQSYVVGIIVYID